MVPLSSDAFVASSLVAFTGFLKTSSKMSKIADIERRSMRVPPDCNRAHIRHSFNLLTVTIVVHMYNYGNTSPLFPVKYLLFASNNPSRAKGFGDSCNSKEERGVSQRYILFFRHAPYCLGCGIH